MTRTLALLLVALSVSLRLVSFTVDAAAVCLELIAMRLSR